MKRTTMCTLLATAALTTATAGISAAADDCPGTANNRYMLLLVDGSGSMTAARTGGGGTRFQAAKDLANAELGFFSGQGAIDGVAVYSFSQDGVNNGIIQKSANDNPSCPGPWVTTTRAQQILAGLESPQPWFGTPLADGMCGAIDILRAKNSGIAGTVRILHVSTDGEENSSLRDALHCGGDPSIDPYPYTGGSWQSNVLTKVLGTPPTTMRRDEFMRIVLFQRDPIVTFTGINKATPVVNYEAAAAKKSAFVAAAAAITNVTDHVFFSQLASLTGGTYAPAYDSAPVPVSGDISGDACIDINDTFEIIRNFGKNVPDADAKYDLNMDRKIGYADYEDLASKVTNECGERDTLQPIQPIHCNGKREVVIDGRSLETGRTAIEARGACRITIRNSRIVAGRNAIQIFGAADIVIDDSIIAGENALVVVTGAARVSAAGTYFKGGTEIKGAWKFIDRGNNTWEQ